MNLFNFFGKQRPVPQGFQAKKAPNQPQLQAFILEPILTPSGLLDGGDDAFDHLILDLDTHPLPDVDLTDVPDADHVDISHDASDSLPEDVGTHALSHMDLSDHISLDSIPVEDIEPVSFIYPDTPVDDPPGTDLTHPLDTAHLDISEPFPGDIETHSVVEDLGVHTLDESIPGHNNQSIDSITPDDHTTIEVETLVSGTELTTDPPTFTFDSGVFTVGETGTVSIDYLFDGGRYQGELAIFSLDGMEQFEPGSHEFIQEAAHRALSDSPLGHVVISDRAEGAKFSGTLLQELDWNIGDYQGVKTVEMNPGDEFGIMLVPNSTVQKVFDNPDAGGAVRPLFSMATANPNDAFHVGQIADVTGDGTTFVMEDLRVDTGSDHDYNDIIFQVRGATTEAPLMDGLIAPGKDWRVTDVGKELLSHVAPSDTPEPISLDFPQSDQPLVGIIDTGFSGDNPDIDYSQIIFGHDYVDGDDNPLLSSTQANESVTENLVPPVENSEHGTHVLGIIGATQDNDIGIDGVNDNAPIWVGRAVGSGQWANSLVEFVDAAKESGQPNAVVNLSFDLTQINPDGSVTTRYEFAPAERAAIEYARQNDVLIVVAAGNDGSVMSALGQASQEFDNIITVGATKGLDDGLERADYSSYGEGLDIVAEGGTVENPMLSTMGNSVGTMAGTSVAAAKVTGATSQVWAANPLLSYRQVIEILKSTATDLESPGWDAQTGAGLLNLAGAISLARMTTPEVYDPDAIAIPTIWSGEGMVIPTERAVATQFMGKYYDWKPYTVKPGDTLSAIANTTMGNGTAPYYNFIAQHNGIANPNLIYVGQTIQIPEEVSAPAPNLNNTVGYDGSSTHQTYINTFNRNGGSSALGSPTNNVHPWSNGYIQDFSGGSEGRGGIMKSNANDLSYWVGADFWSKFLDTGGAEGILHYPTSDRFSTNAGQRQNFQGGAIIKSAKGIFPVFGGIGTHYLTNEGGEKGRLGFPTSGEVGVGNGVIHQHFENGYIRYGDGPTRTIMNTQPTTPVPAPQSSSLAGKKIVLDPGHGISNEGFDPGAAGNGTTEATENLIQANIVAEYLRQRGANVTIVDEPLSLAQIGQRSSGSDVLVSLHLNAFNTSAQGHEVLVHPKAPQADFKLANLINSELDSAFPDSQIPNRGVKTMDLAVLRNAPASVPAVLTEALFIDAPGMSRANVEKAAQAIARGIEKFLTGTTSNPNPSNPPPSNSSSLGSPNFTGKVMHTGVNIRSGPGVNYTKLDSYTPNTPLTFDAWTTGTAHPDSITGKMDNRWFRIKDTNNWVASAYINGNPTASSRYIPPPSNNNSSDFTGKVMHTGVNIRSGPGVNNTRLGFYSANTPLTFDAWTRGTAHQDAITGKMDDRWFRIKDTNNWVASAYINGNPNANSRYIDPPSDPEPTRGGGAITSDTQFLQRLYGHGKGVITQNPNAAHQAIDSVNQGSYPYKVYALANGVINFMGIDQYGGMYIDIWNAQLQKTFRYLHFESFNPNLKKGKTVNAGDFIGVEGYSGNTDPKGPRGRHTHFAVVANGKQENPWPTLNRIPR
jgi:N-acetylmuramoyl-L-alanine amidase